MEVNPTWHLKHATIEKPYAVQLEGMRKSYNHPRFGWFLEQGLGKTALFLNDYVDQHSEYDTIVALCPNSFKMDWGLAPAEWGLDFTYSVWPKDEFRRGTSTKPHINIMNFEASYQRGYEVVKALLNKWPCVLLVDESSAIKNFKSMTARAVLDLCKRAKVVRLLNGTPMTQNVMDLFPQLKCLNQLDGMNPYAFRNRFAEIGGYMGKTVVGVKNEEELHAIQQKCSFRALKEDWSDLPPKIYIPLHLEMTDNQRKHYKEMYQNFCTMVQGVEFDAQMVINQMDKLRQITSGVIMSGDNFKLIDPPEKNVKIKAALDLLRVGNGKMILVHVYTPMGRVILDQMEKNKMNPAYIRGGMKPEELVEQKKKFNEDPTCRVIVCQIQSASKAHTLLGRKGVDRCNITYFHDQTYSLLDRKQMEDRNHRGEQDQNVNYYDPIMSPVDQAQVDALVKKQNIASKVVDAIRALPR